MELRELEQHLSAASVDRTPEEVDLLLALSCCLMGSGRVDTRAEGMYMLKALSSSTGEAVFVEVSERNDGAPLTSFAEFFIDHLLPILALGILLGRRPQEFEQLGERCCRILFTYARLDPRELNVYRAYWSACLRWREAHGPGVTDHLLRRTAHGLKAELLDCLFSPRGDFS